MCRSADNLGRALTLRDAHQTSTQGAWRPRDEVRATSHRPCRFAAPICADSLGALDGDPCRLRARTSCQSAFRWVGCHAVCAPTHLIGGSIPWRIKRRQGHALRGRRAIVKEGEILLLRPLTLLLHSAHSERLCEYLGTLRARNKTPRQKISLCSIDHENMSFVHRKTILAVTKTPYIRFQSTSLRTRIPGAHGIAQHVRARHGRQARRAGRTVRDPGHLS